MLGNHIKIVYASTSGNVEAVCEQVANTINEHGYETSLYRSEQTDVTEIVNHSLFIFAASTWEHGRLNPFFEPLLDEMSSIDLTGKYAGLIGLGDTRYEPVYFCEGINRIEKEFKQKGGKQLANSLKIDGDPYSKLAGEVTDWAHLFVHELHQING